VAEVISAITESSTQVRGLVEEVNSGSQEQTREIESISRSIAEMDRVTQSNAASAEESAAASQELSAQAKALNTLVEQLQQMVGAEVSIG
jgi:methyl-accepting chemotaxis protein